MRRLLIPMLLALAAPAFASSDARVCHDDVLYDILLRTPLTPEAVALIYAWDDAIRTAELQGQLCFVAEVYIHPNSKPEICTATHPTRDCCNGDTENGQELAHCDLYRAHMDPAAWSEWRFCYASAVDKGMDCYNYDPLCVDEDYYAGGAFVHCDTGADMWIVPCVATGPGGGVVPKLVRVPCGPNGELPSQTCFEFMCDPDDATPEDPWPYPDPETLPPGWVPFYCSCCEDND